MTDRFSGFTEPAAPKPTAAESSSSIRQQNKLLLQQLEEMRAQGASLAERSEAIVAQGQLLRQQLEATEANTAALERIADAMEDFVAKFDACIKTDHYPDSPDPVRTGIRVHNKVG
jgi:hypothetical protein